MDARGKEEDGERSRYLLLCYVHKNLCFALVKETS